MVLNCVGIISCILLISWEGLIFFPVLKGRASWVFRVNVVFFLVFKDWELEVIYPHG